MKKSARLAMTALIGSNWRCSKCSRINSSKVTKCDKCKTEKRTHGTAGN